MDSNHIHCVHFGPCSGCVRAEHVNTPPILDEVKQFFVNAGVSDLAVVSGSPIRWRCRAKLVVRGTPQHAIVGLFKAGSHVPLDIPLCQVHHLRINEAADRIRAFIHSEGIVPYDETTGSGELRYVQCVVQRSTGRVQAVFVVNQQDPDERWKPRLERLWQQNSNLWHSFWVNMNVRRDNVIFGPKWLLMQGEESLWERIGAVDFAFSPSTFGQANLNLFERLLQNLCELVRPGATVAEYYAGVGVIGLNLAARGHVVRCCEVTPQAKQSCELALGGMDPVVSQRVHFETGGAGQFVSWLNEVDVAIVDPPRKGLEPALLRALTSGARTPHQLLYVSCGWPAFQRDSTALLNAGWRITSATTYLLFPGTDQLELLVSFER